MAIINGRGRVGIRRPSVIVTTSIVFDGLKLYLDAGKTASYPGTGTTWTDLSGNGYNGTLTNGPTYNSANGGSIVFDGTNDYADFGDVLDIGLNSLSVNLWLKINSNWGVAFVNGPITSAAKYFIGKGVISAQDLRWFLGFTQAKNLRAVFVGNNSESLVLNTNSSLNLNQWYMCTMVADRASSVKLYINGSLQGVDANASMSNFAALNFQNNTPLRVGSATLYDNSSSVTEFPGNISEVQMYFRALSDSEVMQNFNALKSRYGL